MHTWTLGRYKISRSEVYISQTKLPAHLLPEPLNGEGGGIWVAYYSHEINIWKYVVEGLV